MPLVGLTLASTLFFAPPEDTSAPVIVVTPPPAPAAQWGPAGDTSSSRPAPPPPAPPQPAPVFTPPRRPLPGIGLFVGAGVAFGIGLASRLAAVDVAVEQCSRWKTGGYASITQCFDTYDSPGLDQNDMFVGFAYGSSMVLTMIGSGALGQNRAWNSVYGDRRQRNPNTRYAFGAIFAGLGVASIAAHYALVYTDARNPCTTWECNVQRRALWIAASDGGAAMLNTGFGLLSWAGNYRKNRARYQAMRWSVIPGATPGSVGATVALQF